MKDDEKSDIKAVRISDEALIEAFEEAVKGRETVDAQNLGSMSKPIARIGLDEKGEPIVLESYDE